MNRYRKLSRRAMRGMTLIEIIVVITIIAIIMWAVSVAVIPQLQKAKQDRARMDIMNIQTGLKTYYAKKGKYPDTSAGLGALVKEQIFEKAPLDPWDTEYVYMLEAGKPVIISYGEDKTSGGSDNDADISSKDIDKKQ